MVLCSGWRELGRVTTKTVNLGMVLGEIGFFILLAEENMGKIGSAEEAVCEVSLGEESIIDEDTSEEATKDTTGDGQGMLGGEEGSLPIASQKRYWWL